MIRILAALLLVALIALGINTAIMVHYHDKYAEAVKADKELASANITCQNSLQALMTANQEWASYYKSNQQDAAALTKAQDDKLLKLQSSYDALQKSLTEVYAHVPQARAWSVVPVPAAVAQQLRNAAASQD